MVQVDVKTDELWDQDVSFPQTSLYSLLKGVHI